MNNVIDILRERYKSFIKEDNSCNFFFGLADYVRYIENNPDLYKIIEPEIKEKDRILKERDKLENKAIQELNNCKKEIFKIIENNKISNSELEREIADLKLFEKEKDASGTIADNIERYLWNIGKILYELGYKKELKKFINIDNKKINIHFDNYDFLLSNSLIERCELEKNINKLRQQKIWGSWDYLKYVPLIFLDRKESKEIISKNDEGEIDISFNLYEQFRIIESDELSSQDTIQYINPEDLMKNYKLHTNKIHFYLIEKFTNYKENAELSDKKNKIIIDFQKGIYGEKNPEKYIYKISGKRLKIVKQLFESKINVPLNQLVSNTGQSDGIIIKEIGNINKVFRKKLKLKKDLIVNLKTGGGYKLNTENFNIEGGETFT